MILMANSAQAGTVSPHYAGFVGASKTDVQTMNISQSQKTPQGASLDAASDTVGNLAIAKFGCDCMSCRNAVLQMVQAGQLSLSQ